MQNDQSQGGLGTDRRRRSAAVRSREELIYLLSRAAELEHAVACIYLYAAYSLKSDAAEGGLTEAQAAMLRGWKRRLVNVAVEEMLHLAQVVNLMTAIGGAPHFRRPDFPLPATAFPFGLKLSLEPFTPETAERLVCYEMPEAGVLTPEQDRIYAEIRARHVEKTASAERGARHPLVETEPFDIDFSTVGEFYHKVESGFLTIPEAELFIGPAEAQANGRFLDFGGELVRVVDRASAIAAIEMIVEQGEAPTAAHPDAHFWVFDAIRTAYEAARADAAATGTPFEPLRPVVADPTTRGKAPGSVRITDPRTHAVADLFNMAYDTMLLVLLRFFAHVEESEAELEQLSRATLRMMTSVLRPLGEALAKMPVGPEHPGRTAGPCFGIGHDLELLPHKRSAWTFFAERLRHLAEEATTLGLMPGPAMPPEVMEAAAALQALAEEFAGADPSWSAAREEEEFRRIEARLPPGILPERDGPLLVTNCPVLENSRGEKLPVHAEMSLCRCGGSRNKPYCDGSHSSNGFDSRRAADHTPDEKVDYAGAELTVHYNRLQCAAAGICKRTLPEVFRHGDTPYIQPDRTDAHRIMAMIRHCPSGALRYTYKGRNGPPAPHRPSIKVLRNGPYLVKAIPLESDYWPVGSTRGLYTLCRCGASKNKPFCDGSHFRVGFTDEKN